ncbi:MAG: nitrous oxide reductase family maturation protein NosD [Cyclobacteriaceae bacterium]
MKHLTLALILLPLCALAEKRSVCTDCQYASLELAIAASNPHDTILVKQGTYTCINIEITKPISILGEAGVILDGKGEGYVLMVFADSVHLSNMKIINAGHSYTKDYAAVYLSRASHFLVENLTIIDPFFGILIEKCKKGVIRKNLINGVSVKEADAGNGIHLWHCDSIDVDENEIYQMRDGVYLEFVNNSTIRSNYAHDNVRYGLHFMFSNHDRYLNNTFQNNGAGVAVMFSKYIEMRENNFVKNWGTASYGLLLKEIYDAEVIDNLFDANTIGIFLEGSTRINYINNTFDGNGWAVKVSGGCYANIFKANNFISNSFDVSYNAKMNDNEFTGNFWNTYAGYDLDRDGIGDVPYRPVKLFSYIVNRTPETIVLMRSLFVDLINFSEKVSPVFTPDELVDNSPLMKAIR